METNREHFSEIPDQPLEYSREVYEKIEKMLQDVERIEQSKKTDKDKYLEDLDEDQRVFSRTKSHTRGEKIKRDLAKVTKLEQKIDELREQGDDYRIKLHRLYELAHQEALQENDEVNLKRLEERYKQVTEFENADPMAMDSETYGREKQNYEANVKRLVDGIAEFFHHNPK